MWYLIWVQFLLSWFFINWSCWLIDSTQLLSFLCFRMNDRGIKICAAFKMKQCIMCVTNVSRSLLETGIFHINNAAQMKIAWTHEYEYIFWETHMRALENFHKFHTLIDVIMIIIGFHSENDFFFACQCDGCNFILQQTGLQIFVQAFSLSTNHHKYFIRK